MRPPILCWETGGLRPLILLPIIFSAPSVRWRRSAWPTVQGNRPLKAYYRAACSWFIIGLCLVLAMHSGKAAADTQLPILTLAGMVHPLLAWICALFLLCAMLGAAMSVFTPVPRYFSRFERIRKHKTLFSAVLGLAAWAGSPGWGSAV